MAEGPEVLRPSACVEERLPDLLEVTMADSTEEYRAMRESGIWEHFTMADGLPDMRIECLYTDSFGRLWIGTHDRGAVEYDGAQFSVHMRAEGLVGDSVFSIAEDSQRTLWVGTDQAVFWQDHHGFHRTDFPGTASVLWGNCVDLAGRVWFGLEREPGQPARVLRCEGDRTEVVRVSQDCLDVGESIHALVCDPQGRVWAGGNRLYRQTDEHIFEPVPGPQHGFLAIHGLLWCGSDVLWVASETGIWSMEQRRWVLLQDAGPFGVVGLLSAQGGVVWATTYEGGLLRWNGTCFERLYNLNAVLRGGLCEDPVGRLWIGTYGMGLYCLDPNRLRLCHGVNGNSSPVHCVAETASGALWAGTEHGPATVVEAHLEPIPREERLTGYETTALLGSRAGLLWVGTRIGYLFALRNREPVLCAPVDEMAGYSISVLTEDAQGRIWFASRHGGGLGYWQNGHLVFAAPDSSGNSAGWIGALCVDSTGTLWLGSAAPARWEGLWRYDGRQYDRVPGISGSAISALCQLDDGAMAVGTSDGLVFVGPDGPAGRLTHGEGLPCDLITAVQRDRSGGLLIGTQGGGLCRYDGRVVQVLQISGLPGCNVIHAVHQDGDGVIWLGTEGGLVRYAPRMLAPEVAISAIVADTTYAAGDNVEVPTSVGRVRFEYTGRSAQEHAGHLVYSYRLQGWDQEWRQTRDRSAEYPSLKPGDYAFEVQCVDRDLTYSQPARAEFRVVEDPRVAALTAVVSTQSVQGEFLGESAALRKVLQQLREVAPTGLTVLVQGETGTGKGLAARAVHEMSPRGAAPFIHVNCGGLQPHLIESDLFGHERGAFTGAIARRLGKFELAEGGTIFLDEIGDLPPESQTRLLHVLQERTIERIGSTRAIPVDVRVVAATNRDLARAVRQSRFRADLYYRLNVFPVSLPPLRERREDIPLLAVHFSRQFSAHLQCDVPVISDDAMEALLRYDWPGNVRELEHTIQRAVILSAGSTIQEDQVITGPLPPQPRSAEPLEILPLEEFERQYLRRVLEHTGGVIHGKQGAARLLGMKPTTLRSRLQRLGLR